MIIGDLTSSEQTNGIKAAFANHDVRTLIANHLGVSVGRVTATLKPWIARGDDEVPLQ